MRTSLQTALTARSARPNPPLCECFPGPSDLGLQIGHPWWRKIWRHCQYLTGRARQRFRSDGAMTSASWPFLPCRGQRKILLGRDIPRRLITLSFPVISRGMAFSSSIAVRKCIAATLHAVPRDAIGIEIHRAAIALGPPPFPKTGIETFLPLSPEGKLLQSDRLLARA